MNQKSKFNKMRTLHDSFHWDLMWIWLTNVKYSGYTYEKILTKYWKYVNIEYPIKGLSLIKACKIIRLALLKHGCKISDYPYSKNLIQELPFYKDNYVNWKKDKYKIIKMERTKMSKKIQLRFKVKTKKHVETPSRKSVAIFKKPKRNTKAFLRKCKACDLLLQKKFMDSEIYDIVKESTGYLINDLESIRKSLNRGSFIEYNDLYCIPLTGSIEKIDKSIGYTIMQITTKEKKRRLKLKKKKVKLRFKKITLKKKNKKITLKKKIKLKTKKK